MENYLKALITNEDKQDEEELTLIVKELRGSFELPKNFDYKNELTGHLSDKYL